MSTIEQNEIEGYATLFAIATEHIDNVHYELEKVAEEQHITEPERYALPIMIDQSESERNAHHFRIGFTSLAARLALKKTSVVIPLVVSSIEVTPRNRVIPYENSFMRISGEGLRTASLLIGKYALDKLWQYIDQAPENNRVKETLFSAATLIDQAYREAKDKELIPII